MPTGTGLIVGQVVDAATNRGVAGVVVSLGGSVVDQAGQVTFVAGAPPVAPQRVQAMTASDGRFAFRNLGKGNYTITATKGGYLAGGYGRRRPNGPTQSIELADGARMGPFTVPIWKHGVLTGTISDEAGEPVVGITVQAMRRNVTAGKRRYQSAGTGTTDDRGVYRIARLVPGDYIVAVVSTSTSSPASTMDEYNRLMMSGDPAGSALMRKLMDSNLSILRGGLSGQVRHGDTIQTVGDGPTPPPAADGAKMFGYPTLFYPGTPSSAQATPIPIASGEERTGVDIQVKPVPMSSVSGTVVGPNGPVDTIGVRLMPAESDAPTEIEVATTATDRAGNFTLLGVAPGNYQLKVMQIPRPASTAPSTATIIQMSSGSGGGMTMFGTSASDPAAAPPPVPTDPTLWATIPMPVGKTDISGVTIPLRTGVRVSGHLEFEGSKEKPAADALGRLSIVMDSAEGETRLPLGMLTSPGRVQASGQFNTPGLPGGRYILRAAGINGWFLKSALYQGRDISDTPMDLDSADVAGVVITYTDQPSEISGTIRGASGGDADASVIAFPTDTAAWTGNGVTPRRLRLSRATPAGSYKLTGLPAGSYYLAAVPDEFTSDWQDAKFLASLAAGATQVTLDDGQKTTKDVRLVRPR